MRVPLVSGIAGVIRYRSSRKPRRFKPHTYTTDRSFYDQFTIAEDDESITPAMQGCHLHSSSVANVNATVGDADGAVPGAGGERSECIGLVLDALTHSSFMDGGVSNGGITQLGQAGGGSATTPGSRNATEPKVPNFSFPLPVGGQGCGAFTGVDPEVTGQGVQPPPVEVALSRLDNPMSVESLGSKEVDTEPNYTGGYSPFVSRTENVGGSSHGAVFRQQSTPYALTPGLMAMLQPDPPKSKSFRRTVSDFFRLKRFRRNRFRQSMVISAPQMGTPPPGDDFARFIREAGTRPEGGPIRVMFPMLVGSYHKPSASVQIKGVSPEQAEAVEVLGEGAGGPTNPVDLAKPVSPVGPLSPTSDSEPTDYLDYITGCEFNDEAQPLLGYHCASFPTPNSSINSSYATATAPATESEPSTAVTTTTPRTRVPPDPPVIPDMEFQCNRRSGRTLVVSMGFDEFPQFLAAEHRACV